MDRSRPSRRVWLEVSVSVLAVGLAILTMVDPEWIETIFHIDPDEGAGLLELAITLGTAFAAFAAAALAVRDYRRGRPNRAAADRA